MDFKINNEQIVKQYLNKTVKLFTPDRKLEGSNIILFEHYHYAILFHLRFLKSMTYSEKSNLLQKTLFNLGQHDEINLFEDFKNELNNQISAFFQKKFLKFYLIIPSKFESNTVKIKHLKIFDTKILVRDYSWIKKNFDIENKKIIRDIQLHSSLEHFNTSNAFFIIEGYGRDRNKFSLDAEEKFELVRSLINFIERYGRTQLIMWPRRPLSFIKEPPLLFIFNENKEYVDLKFRLNPQKEKSIDFPGNEFISQYRMISNQLAKIKDKKLRNRIILAFKLYNQSLDSYDQNWLCCFYLWQIFEVLFTTKTTDKHEVIPGRIIAFIGITEPFYDIIRYFMQKRHLMIHQAEFNIFTKTDCDAIRGMIDFLIIEVIDKIITIKTFNEYESYLETIDFYLLNQDINDLNLSNFLNKKREIAHSFEKSRIFKM